MTKYAAVSIVATRHGTRFGAIDIASTLEIVVAQNEQEATGIGYAVAEKEFPKEDGWNRPGIQVAMVPEE